MAGLLSSKTKTVADPPLPPTAATPATPKANANPYVPKTTDVAKLTTDITRTDNPLMRQARTQGLKAANSRGLLSSSMAVSAAEDSAYAAAVPMAAATAGYNSAENLQANEIASNERLATAQRALDVRMQRMSLNSTERQQLRQIASTEGIEAANRKLSQYQTDRQLNTQVKIAAADRKLSQYQSDRALNVDSRNKALDRTLQTTLAQWNLNADDREKAAAMLTSYSGTYEQALANINANENLSSEQRTAQIQSLNARRTAYYNTVREMYDVNVSFPTTTKPKKIAG